jgi:hypothetical protein
MAVGHRSKPFSPPVMMALALLLGVLIALADSSPGWDSTGVTAGALFLAGGTTAYLGRTRPWLWALLVGSPTPIVEIPTLAATGSLLALVFASAGAAIGWALARAG